MNDDVSSRIVGGEVRRDAYKKALAALRKREAETGAVHREAKRERPPYDGPEIAGRWPRGTKEGK